MLVYIVLQHPLSIIVGYFWLKVRVLPKNVYWMRYLNEKPLLDLIIMEQPFLQIFFVFVQHLLFIFYFCTTYLISIILYFWALLNHIFLYRDNIWLFLSSYSFIFLDIKKKKWSKGEEILTFPPRSIIWKGLKE